MGQDESPLPGCRVGTLRLFCSPRRLEMVEMVEIPLMRSPHALEGSWEGRRSLQQSPKLPRGSESTNAGTQRCARRGRSFSWCNDPVQSYLGERPELPSCWDRSRAQTTLCLLLIPARPTHFPCSPRASGAAPLYSVYYPPGSPISQLLP